MDGSVSWWRRVDDSGVPLLLARAVLGLTFIYMGGHKLGDPVDFLKLIRQYQMLPETPPIFLNSSAIVLPWLEIVCGVALLVGLRFRGAAACIAIMLCVFTPAILLRALRMLSDNGGSFFDIKFDCGCGAGEQIIWQKLLSNMGLLALAIIALASRSTRWCLSNKL
jgi:uncharacterized membrane protein YphA (DoxX/SURF4 family)